MKRDERVSAAALRVHSGSAQEFFSKHHRPGGATKSTAVGNDKSV